MTITKRSLMAFAATTAVVGPTAAQQNDERPRTPVPIGNAILAKLREQKYADALIIAQTDWRVATEGQTQSTRLRISANSAMTMLINAAANQRRIDQVTGIANLVPVPAADTNSERFNRAVLGDYAHKLTFVNNPWHERDFMLAEIMGSIRITEWRMITGAQSNPVVAEQLPMIREMIVGFSNAAPDMRAALQNAPTSDPEQQPAPQRPAAPAGAPRAPAPRRT